MTTIQSTTSAAPDPAPDRRTLAPGAPRPMFRTLAIAASGLTAQRTRLEVAAQNIANAETTHTAEGGPYRRKIVQLEPAADASTALKSNELSALAVIGGASGLLPTGPETQTDATDPADAGGVRVAGITEDKSLGALVYDPGHPDADTNGYVRMPNVHVTDEMMEMMDARRVYDANATVFQAAKAMLHLAINI